MASEMIYATGERVPVAPANGKNWTLGELQAKVGGYLELARTRDGRFMYVNEDGKRLGLQPNRVATELYIFSEVDIILGNVIIFDTLEEMNT